MGGMVVMVGPKLTPWSREEKNGGAREYVGQEVESCGWEFGKAQEFEELNPWLMLIYAWRTRVLLRRKQVLESKENSRPGRSNGEGIDYRDKS